MTRHVFSSITSTFILFSPAAGSAATLDFETHIITASRGPTLVVAADLDGDGDTDLLSASMWANTIAWYENSGGVFGVQQVISDIGQPLWADAADVDGDGDLDVLAASSLEDVIVWFENTDGLGSFGPIRYVWGTPGNYESLSAEDLDGDGDVDVLVAAHDFDDVYGWDPYRRIGWHGNSGIGFFGGRLAIDSRTNSIGAVSAGDVDGDGDMDVLSGAQGSPTVAWHENTDGHGSFGPRQAISSQGSAATSVLATDLDGDGDLDLLCAIDGIPDTVEWYENTDGAGNFGPRNVISNLLGAVSFVAAADLDGDGDLDVLAASELGDTVVSYENTDGFGAFGPQRVLSTRAASTRSVVAADLDGDGDDDVAYGAATYLEGVPWLENTDGLGTFVPKQLVRRPLAHPEGAVAADLDGDGDLDLAATSFLRGEVVWYRNADGTGLYEFQQVVASRGFGTGSIRAADMDGDGDLDLLAVGSGDLSWFANTDGLGTFGAKTMVSSTALPCGDSAKCVVPADLDGDNDLDILLASYWDDTIVWYANSNGLGSFGVARVLSTTADGPMSVFAADLDGDGDDDVLSASELDDTVAWYENTDGQGNFGAALVISSAADGAAGVFAVDLDRDGDLDALSTSGNDDKIAWYENTDGLGTFGAERVVSLAVPWVKVAAIADLDGDGDIDILSASGGETSFADGNSTVYLHLNTDGLGTYAAPEPVSNADMVSSVSAADLDGDGDLDVLSTSYGDWRLAWDENLGDPCAAAPCQNGGACTNPDVGAGRECDCTATGFTGDNCEIDLDECSLGTDNCDADASCANIAGSFTCACNAGYSGNGVACTDDDECALETDDCHAQATCTNTPGSYACACNAGYSGDGVVCEDDDECSLGTHTCHADGICTNVPGSFTCACGAGYSGDGVICADDDECALGTDNCDAEATCSNLPGSFSCGCNPGYSGDGITCADDDECALGTDNCHADATCSNTPGGFSCVCHTGYSGDGITCADVDECNLGTDNCHADATCRNTPGSFSCGCNLGYSGDGVTCADVDECTAGTHECDQNAICTNTPGSFACTCRPGFLGDGTVCSETPGEIARGRGCACSSGILDASGLPLLVVAMLLRLARRRRSLS